MSRRTRQRKKLLKKAKLNAQASEQFESWLKDDGKPALDMWTPKQFKQYAALCDFLSQRGVLTSDLMDLIKLMQNVPQESCKEYADQLIERRFRDTNLWHVTYGGELYDKFHEFVILASMNRDQKYYRTLYSLFHWATREKYLRVGDIEKFINEMKVSQVMES